VGELAREARLWAQKWRWYERNSLPWNRARIHWELMRREAFARWPLHGNVLEALRERRLEIGPGALLEPNVWITMPGDARVRIGAGTFLNMGVMVAAQELVEIGAHCMLPYCAQLDFLPFRCDSCHRTFCLEHRSETAHQCAHAGEWARNRRLRSIGRPSNPSSTSTATKRETPGSFMVTPTSCDANSMVLLL